MYTEMFSLLCLYRRRGYFMSNCQATSQTFAVRLQNLSIRYQIKTSRHIQSHSPLLRVEWCARESMLCDMTSARQTVFTSLMLCHGRYPLLQKQQLRQMTHRLLSYGTKYIRFPFSSVCVWVCKDMSSQRIHKV